MAVLLPLLKPVNTTNFRAGTPSSPRSRFNQHLALLATPLTFPDVTCPDK
jgi:hypothetical protein